MNEISTLDSFVMDSGDLFGYGATLVAVWWGLLIGGLVYAWVWGWLDDKEKVPNNPVVSAVLKVTGWERSDGRSLFEFIKLGKNVGVIAKSDGLYGWLYIFPSLFLLFAPVIVVKFTTPLIVIVSIAGLLHLARFTLRLGKKLNAHVSDKSVHK